MPADDEERLLVAVMEKIANAAGDLGDEFGPNDEENFAIIKDRVEASPIAIAIWEDSASPIGIGILIVKGEATLRAMVGTGKALPSSMVGIPCDDSATAAAIKDRLGEPDQRLS